MGKRDKRIDAYIARSADFAKPILTHIREVVHAAVPEVEETIKWGMPFFTYHGPLCNMAAFKEHAAFGFWKGGAVLGAKADKAAMGQFGRLTSVRDLGSVRALTAFLKKAKEVNESGEVKARPRKPKPPLPVPPDLAAGLKRSARARATFEKLSPSHRREYVEWIVEAKRPETRSKRLATTLEWLAEGKSRNWKYENC